MLELSGKGFKATTIKMHQWEIEISLETNEKNSLSKEIESFGTES